MFLLLLNIIILCTPAEGETAWQTLLAFEPVKQASRNEQGQGHIFLQHSAGSHFSAVCGCVVVLHVVALGAWWRPSCVTVADFTHAT
jgi:hypothetical protein